MPKKKQNKTKTFKKAVEDTPDIANCYQIGLQGLGIHSRKIELLEGKHCSGSVDIDSCTRAKYPQSNRWDYAFCFREEVFFVEVHTANTREISTVVKKLKWLKDWLRDEAPELDKLKAKSQPFVWIQSKDYHIPKMAPQNLALVQVGIKPISKLSLK